MSEESKSTASGDRDFNLTGRGMTHRNSIQIRPSVQIKGTIRQNSKSINTRKTINMQPRFSSFRNRNTKNRLSRLVCSQDDIEDDDW